MSSLFENVPDIIRDAATGMGINLKDTMMADGAINCIPKALESAYKNGDYGTIDRITKESSRDLAGIYANIQQNEDSAFVPIKNASNQRPYWISFCGPPEAPTGYMWMYAVGEVTQSSTAETNGNSTEPAKVGADTAYTNTMQIGTLSRNTKYLGVSNTLWDNTGLNFTTLLATTAIMELVSRFLGQRLGRTAFGQAITNAISRAGTSMTARFGVNAATWASRLGTFAKFLRGGVIGMIVTFALMFLADFVYREYKCCINIYNHSKHAFAVTSFWGENENLDDDEDFKPAALPAKANTVVLPNGFEAPSDSSIVSYCTYVYVNVNKVLQGLGVAMEVRSNDTNIKGFRLKYDLPRFNRNRMGLSGNIDGDNKSYYENGPWAPNGSMRTSTSLSDGTPITATTTALEGRDDQFYQFDVQIGLAPTSLFLEDSVVPQSSYAQDSGEEETKDVLPLPDLPQKLHTGDTLVLPDGSEATIIDDIQFSA